MAQEENLTPPAGLKPVEREAWLGMAQRQSATDHVGLASFYPARYGEPFVVEGQGVRVAVRPVGGKDVTAHIDNGQVIYREAYPETDSVHVVSSERSEEFLYLQNECAPREFAYELSEVSAGTRVELVKGEVRFTNKAGHGVKIEAPWLIEATGGQRAGAVRWELEERKSGALQRLRLVVAEGLSYPVLIDPSWVGTGGFAARRDQRPRCYSQARCWWREEGDTLDPTYLAEVYDPATGVWAETGGLLRPRTSHTATLLPSGKVLVAGGIGLDGFLHLITLSSAELYDPATQSWSSTGSLFAGRHHHTATLLRNGKVLVAGGTGGISAELYDPATGSWSSTGSLNIGRRSHTATLLPNGKVLVAGGHGPHFGPRLSSAELYDPATGSWSTTASLNNRRAFHTATLLPNGKVLVAGGEDGRGNFGLASAELYDWVTGSWSSTGSLAIDRFWHTATLVANGNVLVAGGTGDHRAELYDSVTGSWSTTASAEFWRYRRTATLLPNGNVLVGGGDWVVTIPAAGIELSPPVNSMTRLHLHLRRLAIRILPTFSRSRLSAGRTIRATIAMIAALRFRCRSQSAFTGRPLTVQRSAPTAL